MAKTNIEELVNDTADAMSNMYDITVSWPWNNETTTAEVSYRCDGFKINTPEAYTYDVNYHGVSYKKYGGGVKLDRTFELKLRLDATYEIYAKWKTWNKVVVDANNGGSSNTTPYLGQITITAVQGPYTALDFSVSSEDGSTLDGNTNFSGRTIKWQLYDVAVMSVEEPSFENVAQGKSLKYSVKGTYGRVNYPFFDQDIYK